MLAPFAPYLAQEIWEELGNEGPVFRQSWPAFDPELAKEDEAEIVVQVNGKLRSRIYRSLRHAEGRTRSARAGRRKGEALPRGQAGGEGDHRARQARQYRGEVGQASRPVHVLQHRRVLHRTPSAALAARRRCLFITWRLHGSLPRSPAADRASISRKNIRCNGSRAGPRRHRPQMASQRTCSSMRSRRPPLRRARTPSLRTACLGPNGQPRSHSDLPRSRSSENHQVDQELFGAPVQRHSRAYRTAVLARRIV